MFCLQGWSKPFTVFENLYKWNKPSVEVCWGTIEEFVSANHSLGVKIDAQDLEPLPRDIQKMIQTKIQSQYTLQKTGIEFTGWKICSQSPQADIIMYATSFYKDEKENLFGSADIGMADKDLKSKRDRKGFIFLNKVEGSKEISSNEKLLLTAVHEFGHAAGLRHEHIRLGADKDENCDQRILEYGELVSEINATAQYVGKYDPESVMNYCYEWYLRNRQGFNSFDDIHLSAQDRQTLLCMYAPDKVPAELCGMKNLKDEILDLNK